MARKSKTSVKPVGKRAQSKGKEKPTKEESSSDMSEESEVEVVDPKRGKGETGKAQSEGAQNDLENVDQEFKIELPAYFDSFDEFVAFIKRCLRKIEKYIADKESKHDENSDDDEEKGGKGAFDPARLFHVYGALLKKLLVLDVTQENLVFRLFKLKDKNSEKTKSRANLKDHVKKDFLKVLKKKKKLKSLTGSKLRFNITNNEELDANTLVDEEELNQILFELVQKYESAVGAFGSESSRKSYFDSEATEQGKAQQGKGKKNPKKVEKVTMTTADKVRKLAQELSKERKGSQDMDIETEEIKGGEKTAKDAAIGGSYEILTPKQANEMEEEANQSASLEREFQERLLEEYNDPQQCVQKLEDGSVRFTSKLIENENISNCSFYTVLLACIVYGGRVAQIENEVVDQESLEDLVETPSFIPFPLENYLKRLQTKHLISRALDMMLELELKNCVPLSTYHKVLKSFKEDSHETNVASLELCPKLCKLYQHKNCSTSTETYKKLDNYRKQLEALTRIFKYFVEDLKYPKVGGKSPSKPKKASLDQVHVLYTDARQIRGVDEFLELEFLRTEFNIKDHEEANDSQEPESSQRLRDSSKIETEAVSKPAKEKEADTNKMMKAEEPPAEKADRGDTSAKKSPAVMGEKVSPAKDTASKSVKKQTPKDKKPQAKDLNVMRTEEEKAKEYEDDLFRQMKQLKSCMTLEQATRRLKDLEKDPKQNQPEILSLQEQIKNTDNWLSYYDKAIVMEKRNFSKCTDLMNKLEDVDLRTDEMVNLFEKYLRYRIWKNKFSLALKSLKTSWKTPTKSTVDEDNLGSSKDYSEMLTLHELQQILEEANGLNLDEFEESKVKELKIKAIQARNLQEKISEILPTLYDVNLLLNYENEIRNFKIKLPQLEFIHARRQLNQNVLDLINETAGIDQIEEFLNGLGESISEVDIANYNRLQEKLTQGTKLRETAYLMNSSEKGFYYYEDVIEVREVVKQIEDFKISFKELEKLRIVLKTFAWLFRLYYLIRGDPGAAEYNAHLLLTKLDAELPRFKTEELLEVCKNFLEGKGQDPQNLKPLKDTIESGESIMPMADIRIEQLYNDFCSQVWLNESENFLSRSRTSRELERFLNEGSKKLQTKIDQETLQLLHNELEKVKDWKQKYDEIIETNIESYLRSKLEKDLRDPVRKEKLLELKWKLTKLRTEFTVDLSKYSDLEEKNVLVQKYLNWITWCSTVEETINNVEMGTKISSFEDLKQLYNEANEYGIPKSMETYKKVESWYTLAMKILKHYRHKFDNEKLSAARMSLGKSFEKDSVQKLVEKLRNRPSQTEAIKIKNDLENKANFISFSHEIEHVETILLDYQDWRNKLEQFTKHEAQQILKSAAQKGEILKTHEDICQGIENLKISLTTLDIRNEEDEVKLGNLEWQYQTYVLLKKRSSDVGIEEWEKLIAYVTEHPEADSTQNRVLANFLNEEMTNCKQLHKLVRSLQKKDKSIEVESPEDAERLLVQMQECLIKLPEDESFLNELTEKAKKLAARSNQLVKSKEKQPIIEFTKTLDQIQHFPIAMKWEEERLQTVVNKATSVAALIQKNSPSDLQKLKKLLDEYDKSPVLITEVEKLRENFAMCEKNYQQYEEELCTLIGNYMSVTFEEIHEMSRKLDEIKWDFDGQLTQKKMQVYILKIEHIQRYDSGELTEPISPISYQLFKSFLTDGYNLRKEITDNKNLDEVVEWTEKTLKRIQEKVHELNHIKSVEILDKLPTVIFGYVDYSQEIIERKASLLAKDVAPAPQVRSKYRMEEEDVREGRKLSNEPKTKREPKKQKKDTSNSKETNKDKKVKEEKEKKKRVEEKKPVESAKPADPYGTIKDVLLKNENLQLESKEAKTYAYKIADAFPLIKESQDSLVRFTRLFKNILKYSYIAKNLQSIDFDVKEIRHLLKKRTNDELLLIDRKLADIAKKKSAKQASKEADAKKKVKTDDASKNMLDPANSSVYKELKSAAEPGNKKVSEKMDIQSEKSAEPQKAAGKESKGKTQGKSVENRKMDVEESKTKKPSKDLPSKRPQGNLSGNLSLAEQKEAARIKNLEKSKKTDKPAIPGVYKIHEGSLITAEANLSVKIGLYSCSTPETIKKIPEIVTEQDGSLKIKGYTPTDRFTLYLNDVLDEADQNYVISGWIDSEDDSQRTNLELLAQDLLSSNSVGVIRYLDSAKIFFLHKSQILSKWTQQLGFEVRSLRKSSSPASLAFVLIYEPSKSHGQELRRIAPKAVTSFQGTAQTKPQAQTQPKIPTKDAQSKSTGALSSQIDDLLKPPVVSIKPEFLNMDSNSGAERNNTPRSQQGFSGFEQRQQGYPSQNIVFDPYNEEPVYQEEVGFGNQFRQSRGFKTGFNPGFSRENSRDASGRSFQKNYNIPRQQQQFKQNNFQQKKFLLKKFFKPTNTSGFTQRQPYQTQFERSNSQTHSQNTSFIGTTAPQYPTIYPKRQENTVGGGYLQRNPSNARPFNPQSRVSTSRSPNDLGPNPFYAEYLKKKGKTAGSQHPSTSPTGRFLTPKNYNSPGGSVPHDTNKMLQEDDKSTSPVPRNPYTKSQGQQHTNQNFKFSTHQQYKENVRGTYTSQTSFNSSRSNPNMFSNKPYSQTYTAKHRK